MLWEVALDVKGPGAEAAASTAKMLIKGTLTSNETRITETKVVTSGSRTTVMVERVTNITFSDVSESSKAAVHAAVTSSPTGANRSAASQQAPAIEESPASKQADGDGQIDDVLQHFLDEKRAHQPGEAPAAAPSGTAAEPYSEFLLDLLEEQRPAATPSPTLSPLAPVASTPPTQEPSAASSPAQTSDGQIDDVLQHYLEEKRGRREGASSPGGTASTEEPTESVAESVADGASAAPAAADGSIHGFGALLAEGSSPLKDMREFCIEGGASRCIDQPSDVTEEALMTAAGEGEWPVALFPGTRNAVAREYKEGLGYADKKNVVFGTSGSGELKLKFTAASDRGYLLLCTAQCDWGRCPAKYGTLQNDTQVNIDDKKATLTVHKNPCYKVDSGFDAGDHILAIKVLTAEKYLPLSYFIWW
ncbi:hypothetical protein CYMTET_49457 [Cymbomonas tetramitiformis]|uniref:Uncharacterized protein n=1 Tax=Cymbomonas tetramitiformis TaxID=36881 RepID=A0AAE0BRC7_9CHLO|nr:hypothetical protein CYMTET_49457 [Cymbomonas tetramitiformis]